MSQIVFEKETDIAHERADPVSPLIRRIVANNPGPFTYTGTATYIVGHGEVAVIDPGPADDEHLTAILEAVGDETVSHILVTHTHRDHSPLAAALKSRTGAAVYAYGPHGSGRLSRARPSGEVRLDAAGDIDFSPDVTLADGDVLSGRGWTLEAVFTPGHCSNHMAFALKEENTLFSGDHVMAWSTSVIAPPDGHMADYMTSLRRLLDRPEDLYWPGHGPSKTNARAFVRAFIGHRQQRERSILQRLEAGDRSIMEIVNTIYRDVDPRLHKAAALSVLAHLEHLIDQGKAAADGEPEIDAVFRPAG